MASNKIEASTEVKVTLATLDVRLKTLGVTLKEIKDLFDGHIREDRDVQLRLRYSIDGHDDEPGIRGRLQTLESFTSQAKWVTALSVGSIITGGIGYLLFGR